MYNGSVVMISHCWWLNKSYHLHHVRNAGGRWMGGWVANHKNDLRGAQHLYFKQSTFALFPESSSPSLVSWRRKVEEGWIAGTMGRGSWFPFRHSSKFLRTSSVSMAISQSGILCPALCMVAFSVAFSVALCLVYVAIGVGVSN